MAEPPEPWRPAPADGKRARPDQRRKASADAARKMADHWAPADAEPQEPERRAVERRELLDAESRKRAAFPPEPERSAHAVAARGPSAAVEPAPAESVRPTHLQASLST
jgi:hypothetical protein